MQTKRLAPKDAMMILEITKQTASDIVMGRRIDAERLARHEFLHQLVTGRPAGVMASIDPEEDIRVKIAQQRAGRYSRIKAARRATAA